MKMGKRDSFFDVLRGFAIILVIGIHTYHVTDFNSIYGWFTNSLREFCNIAVPLFLAISGYFIGKKELNKRTSYFNF